MNAYITGNSGTNYVSFQNETKYSRATLEENGSITLSSNNTPNFRNNLKISIILAVTWMIVLLTTLFCTKSLLVYVGVATYLLYGHTNLIFSLHTIYLIIKTPSLARMHGAEHKVYNFYKQNETLPTSPKDLEDYSRFTNDCGSIKVVSKAVFFSSIALLCIIFQNSISLTFLSLFLFIIIWLIAIYTKVFIHVQKILTQTPTEKELNVAIAALKNLL